MKMIGIIILTASLSLLGGCGRPGGSGGDSNRDFPVNAIIAPVKSEALKERVSLVGSLQSIERVDLVSELDAKVEYIGFEEGKTVTEGQILFELDKDRQEASLEDARARLRLAELEFVRNQNLRENETIPQRSLDEAVANYEIAQAAVRVAEEQLDDSVIKAPITGSVTERLVSMGQFVTRGTKLISLVQTKPLEVKFNVPERYVAGLTEGQTITINTAAYPDMTFEGPVVFVSPELDTQSRTLLMKAEIPNGEGSLKPGMYANLELIFGEDKSGLTIPESAIQLSGEVARVVVMNEEDLAEFREVTVGKILEGRAEIVEGLSEGERVVVEGFQKMGPGSKIRISEDSAKYGITPPPESN